MPLSQFLLRYHGLHTLGTLEMSEFQAWHRQGMVTWQFSNKKPQQQTLRFCQGNGWGGETKTMKPSTFQLAHGREEKDKYKSARCHFWVVVLSQHCQKWENFNKPTLHNLLQHLISKSSLRLHFRTDHSSTGQILPTARASNCDTRLVKIHSGYCEPLMLSKVDISNGSLTFSSIVKS